MKTIKTCKLVVSVCIFVLLQLLSSGLSANPENCTYTWIVQNSGVTNTLYSVEAINDLICWTAGSNSTVRRTTDGGNTWLNANPNAGIIIENIDNIEAIDANNAWVSISVATMTYIYKTTNGGITWVLVHSGTQGYINGIHMTSETNGFAFGDPIASVWRILVTSNGGINWTHLQTSPSGPPPAQGFRNSFQVSLPYIWFSSYPAEIIRSTDAGLSWTLHSAPGSGMATIFSIHFNSASLGFASSINMVKSEDTGTTYKQHAVPGLGNINGVQGSGNYVWYIRGMNIYQSTDSGDTWAMVHTTASTQLDFDIPDNNTGCVTGWSVGHGGSISKMTSGIVGNSSENYSKPNEYSLDQNYPNPFNPSTIIRYSIPEANHVNITVYNILGKEVTRLVNSNKQAGNYEVEFNAENLSSGIYIYKIESGRFTETRKMLLIK